MNLKAKSKEQIINKKNESKFENSDLKYLYLAANAAYEKKGENIVLLDVSKLTVIADYFLFVTANSPPQIEAIAKHIEETLKKENYIMILKEGHVLSNWMVLDFGNIIVHIMKQEIRDHYRLERFWSNGIIINSKEWKKAS